DGCVITLGDAQGGTLAAVVLPEPGTVMMMKPPRPGQTSAGPQLSFERCVIRGKGDLVWCRSSRPFQLRVNNSLAALDGSVLTLEAGKSAEAVMMSGGDAPQQPAVDLRRVTTLLSGNL